VIWAWGRTVTAFIKCFIDFCIREWGLSDSRARGNLVRVTRHKTPGESSEIRMRLLEGSFILYTKLTFLSVRVSRIRAKLVCLSITSKTG